jgi:hypothetical protein
MRISEKNEHGPSKEWPKSVIHQCLEALFSSRRLVVQVLLGRRLESPTRLSGQVGRLAGDLIFPVD